MALAIVMVSGCGDGGTTGPSANRAPTAVGTIPDRTLHAGETATVDVSPRFTDPDGDALSYGASSSDPSVATVSVSGSTVTVSAFAQGSATITVSASDPAGLTATQTTNVTVLAPGPDLVFTEVSPATATRRPGSTVTFTFRVRNQGTAPSAATRIRAVRSPNPIISGRDTEIGSYSFAALGAQEERAFPVTISVDARSAPGTIYIGMCVNAVTDESNTRNNCSDGARLTIAALSTGREQAAVEQSAIRVRAYGPPAETPGGHKPRDWTR